MFDPTQSVISPVRPRNAAGALRQVGIEIEFAGLSALDTAQEIKRKFGGTIGEINRHRFRVSGTSLGDFRAELDSRFAHPEGVLPSLDERTSDWLRSLSEVVSATIGDTGAIVIPCEVITPPVAWDALPAFDELIGELRRAGAKGTDQSVFYAFGLHLNPEIATADPVWLVSVIKSQILLSAWLRSVMAIDTSRYLTSFATPFPDGYAERVLNADYDPDLGQLISDYIAYNPTRDRELDMLPLFASLDEERVRHAMPSAKINPRPTFHYRLPNAALERAAWSIVLEWNRWCLVERLADDKPALEALTMMYHRSRLSVQDVSWAVRTSEWLAHFLNRSGMYSPQ